jgi:hypothetical protein
VGSGVPLPPGRLGLPLVGETLAFLKNPFAFLEERRARHGKVFKSNIVGRRVVFISGLEGAEAFYDPAGRHARPPGRPPYGFSDSPFLSFRLFTNAAYSSLSFGYAPGSASSTMT